MTYFENGELEETITKAWNDLENYQFETIIKSLKYTHINILNKEHVFKH